MKLKNFLAMMVIALCAVACSDDNSGDPTVDPVVDVAQAVAGTYSGYTSATFTYSPTPVVTPSEKVTITAASETTVNITYSSETWGNYTMTDVPVESSDTEATYAVSGSGKVTIGMHGNSAEYDYTFAGTIGSGKSNPSFVITLPAVMGGTTITFIEGEAPAAYLVAGTYNGYTSAEFTYSSTPMITPSEKVTVTAASETTVNVTYSSETWGEYTMTGIPVETSGSAYTMSGSGKVSIGMHGNSAEYDYTFAGTVGSDKSNPSFIFTLPAVMGGTTITFIEGEAPAASVVAGSYTGDLTLTVGSSSDAPIENSKVTVAAQEDGNITVTLASFSTEMMGSQMTLGDIKIENVKVEAGEDNAYTLSGDVDVPVSFGESSINVTGTVSGTITKGDADSAEITFQLKPGAMPMPITAVFKTK